MMLDYFEAESEGNRMSFEIERTDNEEKMNVFT